MSRRDAGVVRQQYDYSCGVAALATLLTHYFQEPVSEHALLSELEARPGTGAAPRDGGLSFADLAWLSRRRGLTALGVAVSAASLRQLRQPAILQLVHRSNAHFTVLRGIDSRGAVLLADPSWGQRYLSRWEFARLLAAGGDGVPVLLLAPAPGAHVAQHYFRSDLRKPLYLPGSLRQ